MVNSINKLVLTILSLNFFKIASNPEISESETKEQSSIQENKFHRFEPINLYEARRQFILSNFNKFSNYITLKKPSSLNEKLECIYKEDITNDNKYPLFSYSSKDILNSNDPNLYYPFKQNITNYLSKNLTLSFQTQKKLSLSLYIFYDLKGN